MGWDVCPAAHHHTDLMFLLILGFTPSSGFIETLDVLVGSTVMGSNLGLFGQPPGVCLDPYIYRQS